MAIQPFVIPTDCQVQGNFSAKAMTLAPGSVGDSQVAAAAGIGASKLQQPVRKVFAQGSGVTAASATFVMHVVIGATATVIAVSAGAVVPAIGTDTCTVDIKKNGSSILSAPISLTSSQSARQTVAGAITTAGAVVGDVFEIVVTPTHSTGTLATGIFCELKLYEDAA